MRPRVVPVSCVVLLSVSAYLVLLGYLLIDSIDGIDSTEDVVLLLEGITFIALAIWSIVTAVGLLRLRRWARRSAIWIGRILFLAYVPEIGRYGYVVKTAPDIGWSWQALYPLAFLGGAGALVLVLCSTPQLKSQFRDRASDNDVATPFN